MLFTHKQVRCILRVWTPWSKTSWGLSSKACLRRVTRHAGRQPLPHLSAVTHYTQSSLDTLAPLQVHIQRGHKLRCPHVAIHSILSGRTQQTDSGCKPQHSLLECFQYQCLLFTQQFCYFVGLTLYPPQQKSYSLHKQATNGGKLTVW